MTEPTKQNESEEQRSAPEQTPPMQPIVDMGAVTTRTARGTVYCLTVIGQIEGHSLLPNTVKTTKYEHVLPLLAALDESEEIDGVLLLLNTCGGDVEAGLAIAELIAGMRKPTVSLVLGGGHSIGVPLAVAPKRSLIAPSASMTAAQMSAAKSVSVPMKLSGEYSYIMFVPSAFASSPSCFMNFAALTAISVTPRLSV